MYLFCWNRRNWNTLLLELLFSLLRRRWWQRECMRAREKEMGKTTLVNSKNVWCLRFSRFSLSLSLFLWWVLLFLWRNLKLYCSLALTYKCVFVAHTQRMHTFTQHHHYKIVANALLILAVRFYAIEYDRNRYLEKLFRLYLSCWQSQAIVFCEQVHRTHTLNLAIQFLELQRKLCSCFSICAHTT